MQKKYFTHALAIAVCSVHAAMNIQMEIQEVQ